MKLKDVDWNDSQIEKITVEFDKAELLIETDSGKYVITCTGLVGLTDLCIWDDTIVDNIYVKDADRSSDGFLQKVFKHYDENFDYGEERVLKNLLNLSVSLVNGTVFSLYCKQISVSAADD